MAPEKNLYEILEVDSKSTQEEIRLAYKRRVKKCHPDHGGDASEFKLVGIAYQVLSDSVARKEYDLSGHYTIKESPAITHDRMIAKMTGIFLTMVERHLNEENVLRHNYIDLVRTELLSQITELTKAKERISKDSNKLEKIKKRIKYLGSKNNMLLEVLQHKINSLTDISQEAEEEIDINHSILNILATYDFDTLQELMQGGENPDVNKPQ